MDEATKHLENIVMWFDRLTNERDDSPDRHIYQAELEYAILSAKKYLNKTSTQGKNNET